MTKDSGSKADGVNFVEIRRHALEAVEGDKPDLPKPKRKRGFHRALKRGAQWAVTEKAWIDMMNAAAKAMFNAIADENCQRNHVWGLNAQLFEGKK